LMFVVQHRTEVDGNSQKIALSSRFNSDKWSKFTYTACLADLSELFVIRSVEPSGSNKPSGIGKNRYNHLRQPVAFISGSEFFKPIPFFI
jgi:hypothetical protein